jgi:hypothetical protein
MAPAHGIWVPRCEGRPAFTSKMEAIRYADYHDRPSLWPRAFFSGDPCKVGSNLKKHTVVPVEIAIEEICVPLSAARLRAKGK